MRVPRFLTYLMPFLLICALSRMLFAQDTLDLTNVLVKLQQSFDFNLSDIMVYMRSFGFDPDLTLYSWDSSLTGIDGFFTNIRFSISSFFDYVIGNVGGAVGLIAGVVAEGVSLLLDLLNIFAYLFGIVE